MALKLHNPVSINKTFMHRLHMFADLAIGSFAIGMYLFAKSVFPQWFQVDMFFHMTVAVTVISIIVLEKVLHRKLHEPSLLHKSHLYAEAGIGSFAVVTFLVGDFLATYWTDVDFAFHIIIATVAFGAVLWEKVLHKHSGVI